MADKTEPQPCRTCVHFNNGNGDAVCLFCDSEFEDRWTDKIEADENDGINKID